MAFQATYLTTILNLQSFQYVILQFPLNLAVSQLTVCILPIVHPVSKQVVSCMAPGIDLFTLTWVGPLDSGASQTDHRLQLNSKEFSTPLKIIKMVSRDSKDLQDEV